MKTPSWVIRLKPDSAHYDTDTPPEKEAQRPVQEYSDETESYPAKNVSISESGSVVVHDGSRDDDPQVDTSGIYTQVDSPGSSTSSDPHKSQINSLGSPNSPNPRKRSAKAASLPDSIPPDDEYQGTRHKVMMTKIDPSLGLEPVSRNTSTTKSIVSSIPIQSRSVSLDELSVLFENIPPIIHCCSASLEETGVMPENVSPIDSRSASLDKISVTAENIPLHQDLEPIVPGSPSVTSEHLSLNRKGAVVDNVPDGTPLHSAETPLSKIGLSGTEPLTEANLLQRNYDTLFTRGCNGSLSDTEYSDREKEDLVLSLESIGSPSFFTCPGFNPLPQTPAEIAEKHKPKLILDNDVLYVQTPSIVYSATYQIAISLKVWLQKGKSRDWWELVVSGLPRLAQFEFGYLYFRTPPGQGMEFMTSSFKRHTLVESCLMAQFYGGKSLVIPLRKCNAEYYGQLKDYKVNTVIRAEVAEASDPSSYLIKYNAVCSIDLINHNFWSEKCQFYIFVHGGPDGEFDAFFTAKKPLINSVRLQPADGSGISRINIISVPQALEMFTVSWDVKLPRGKAVTWLPWINTTFSCKDAKTILQDDYIIYGPKHEVVPLKHQSVDTRCQFSCGQLGELNRFKPTVHKTPHLHGPLFGKVPTSKSTSTQTLVAETPALRSRVAVTPVAEPKKPRRVRGLWTLWALIMFFFQLLCLLASVHTIYWSYLLRNCVFREVYVYGPVDYAEHFTTNGDVEKEADTVLEEFNLQPELIQSEVQQYINTTPADITPMPLRDRIDYFLGWRGPIARG